MFTSVGWGGGGGGAVVEGATRKRGGGGEGVFICSRFCCRPGRPDYRGSQPVRFDPNFGRGYFRS